MTAAPSPITVLCWDNPRCVDPLRAAIEDYRGVRPDAEVTLALRTLAEFNDQPIESAAASADLIVFDYPMAPRAADSGALLPVDRVGDPLAACADSFEWEGREWGIPVDFASHVSALRADLLAPSAAPTSWSEVLEFAASHPDRLALPLFHSDTICSLLSMTRALDGSVAPDRFAVHRPAVELLVSLARFVDPALLDLNPPAVLELMATTDRWWYAPLTFGYSAFADAPAGRYPIAFGDAPVGPAGIGSLLGGAGFGVSATSAQPDEARAFAAWYASPEVQRDVVLAHGGQPSSESAWDAATTAFYPAARPSADAAFRRPAHPRWPDFQLAAGLLLNRGLRDGADAAHLAADLDSLLASFSFPFTDEKVIAQ